MIQIYTGNGKGKTTAAIGLAVRAAGAGMNIFIGQFLKGRKCGEHKALAVLKDKITVRQFGKPGFVRRPPSPEDRILARKGIDTAAEIAASGKYDMVILDEIFTALKAALVSEADIDAIIDRKHDKTELVLTGRGATKHFMERADLVTEMKEIKHYYRKGVKARKGMEF